MAFVALLVARSVRRGPIGWRRPCGLGLAAGALAALTAGCVALVHPVTGLNNPGRGLRVLAAGTGLGSLALSPGGVTLYVADYGNPSYHGGVPGRGQGDTVTPVNVATGKPGRPVRVGALPDEMVMTPDGRTLYAIAGASYGPGEPSGPWSVFMISVQSGKLIKSVRIDSPVALTVAPTGAMLYVRTGGNSVIAINAVTGKSEGTFEIAPAGSNGSVPGYDAISMGGRA